MGHLGHSKQEVFKALADRLDKNPTGAPFNSTLMEILYRMYTETEAEIGSKFPTLPATLEKLSARTGIPEQELKQHLDNMANKGLVIDLPRGDECLYMLTPLVIGFFEYTFMRVTDLVPMQELAELFEAYHHEKGVAEAFFGGETKMFHTLPFESALPEEVTTEVLSYEKASDIIRDSGGGALTMCYCRHQAQHLGKNCSAPIDDVCTALGRGAEWLIRRGFARPASVDELLRVLEQTEKLGLVHLGDNVQNSPAYICHCCGCCCGVLRALNEHQVMPVHPSNFIPKVNTEVCNGCGRCVKKCHIAALKLTETIPGDRKSQQAELIVDRCIGCGVCIPACNQKAIAFIPRPTRHVPPVNKKDQMTRMLMEKK